MQSRNETLTLNTPAIATFPANASAAAPSGAKWTRILGKYQTPSHARGLFELAVTVLPLAGLWSAAIALFWFGYWWLAVLLIIPAAAFLVRLFMIQHDCGHGSFFPGKLANDWCGRIIGVLTLTPYDFWRRTHGLHHATCGNLDRRGIGDINTLTVEEYRALPALQRLAYRIYRHPLVLFLIGPAYLFLLQQRLPVGMMLKGWQPWASTQITNASVAAFVALFVWLVGWQALVFIHLPIVLVAASAGVWLFYVQHQFEETSWREQQDWNFQDAALEGSSYYDLPAPLRWLTANIGMHHVHHLASRIPYYRLPAVLSDFPELKAASRLTLLESLGCVKLALWDEGSRRLVGFKAVRC